MSEHEAVVGTVESWSDEAGWGVLRTPSGLSVFCHFSQVDDVGYRSLAPGSPVYFDTVRPGQDGCDARVRTSARLAVGSGDEPPLRAPGGAVESGSAAYRSGLTIGWDDHGDG
jgi:cold shock CspA family protein